MKVAAKALDDKKAYDIKAIRIGGLTIIADYFLLASGTSSTHVKALADEVEWRLKEAGITHHHIEGKSTTWILLDYGAVIIHIFLGETREFFALERLWADGEILATEQFLGEQVGV